MIIQLIASHRVITALPNWAVDEYLDAGWVQTRPLGKDGVWRTLYAAKRSEDMGAKYVLDFITQAQQRSEEHTSELQSRGHLVCRLLLEKKKKTKTTCQRR